jgi:hypothetical protein
MSAQRPISNLFPWGRGGYLEGRSPSNSSLAWDGFPIVYFLHLLTMCPVSTHPDPLCIYSEKLLCFTPNCAVKYLRTFQLWNHIPFNCGQKGPPTFWLRRKSTEVFRWRLKLRSTEVLPVATSSLRGREAPGLSISMRVSENNHYKLKSRWKVHRG